MQTLNVNAINTVNFSSSSAERVPFYIWWIHASTEKDKDALNYRFHRHTFFEIHFITAGCVTYGFGERNVAVNGGEYIIVSPACKHKVAWHSGDFGKLTLAFEVSDDSNMEGILRSMEGRAYGISGEVEEGLNEALIVAAHKSGYRTELLHLALCGLIFRIAERAETVFAARSAEEKNDDRLLKAKKYIEDNPDIFFTCEEVAQHCHVSAKQLGRLFRKHEQMGLLAFLHAKKLEAAKRMLLESDRSPKQIAEALGFSDVHYFSKFFVRFEGMTPGAFRNKQSNA